MATKTHFEDPSTGSGVFVGDLKYGRCMGTNIVKHKDFPAEGNENQPAAPLILVSKRDPSVWQNKDKKRPRKNVMNNEELRSQLQISLMKFTNGLSQHVRRVKIGKSNLI
jgi:hypothetical protein